MGNNSKLTVKQLLFCEEYLVDLNASKAAVRAGYSDRCAKEQGYRLLTYAHIQEQIAELMKLRSERVQVTADYVIQTIVDTVERCSQARPVQDKAGCPVMVGDPETGEMRPLYKFDGSVVLRGAELLGRHLNMFSDRIEHTGAGGRPMQLITSDVTSEQAAELYRRMFS